MNAASRIPLASGNLRPGFREMMAVFRHRRFCFDDPRTNSQHARSLRHAAVMMPDDSPSPCPETEIPSSRPRPANDSGDATAYIDPRILIIARTIGRQIAREQLDNLQAANDNRYEDEC